MMRLIRISTILLLILLSCKGPDKAELTHEPLSKSVKEVDPKVYSNFARLDAYNFEPEKKAPIADYVRRIFRDSNGNLWLATNSLGVGRYDNDTLVYFSTKNGLSGNQVTGIIEDQYGNIWFSTNNGVSKYDGNGFTSYTTENGLSSNSVWSIFEDSRGIIWVGTKDGLCKLEPATGTAFSSFHLPKATVSNATPRFSTSLVSAIMEDKDGNLWFGTDGVGVSKYDPSAEKGRQFTHYTKQNGLCGNNIVSILQAADGKLWFSSRYGGLSHFDGRTFTNLNMAKGDIGSNEVWTMLEDNDGNIWFSSEGFGVYRYDGNSLTNFGIAEGLPVRAVQSIYQDKTGLFWIGGGGGLYIFDGKFFNEVTRKGPWGMC